MRYLAGLTIVLTLGTLDALGTDATVPRTDVQRPTFRSGVALLEVAAVVRDAHGRIVADLEKSDFRILEEGVPQPIATFDHVMVPPAPASPASGLPSPRSDMASNEGLADARIFVLVLDALHIAPQRTPATRQYARQFVAQHTSPPDIVAIVTPGGVASATQDFTTDRARLLSAIDEFSGAKLRSATIQREEERDRAEKLQDTLHGGRDPEDAERASGAQSLSSTLERLAQHLEGISGRRKTLLLFSEGIDYNDFDVMGTVQRSGSGVTDMRQRAAGALMRANVSLYSIDPRGLGLEDSERIESPSSNLPERTSVDGSPDVRERGLSNPGLKGEYDTSIRSLRELAEPTGGFAVVNSNEFGTAFTKIDEESSNYYVLGYAPEKSAKAREFRRITVQVTRPGLRVNARRGYVGRDAGRPNPVSEAAVDMPAGLTRSSRMSDLPRIEASPPPAAPKGLDATLHELLASPLPRAGLPLRVQAIPFRGDRTKAAVQLVIEVVGAPLQFAMRGGRAEERIDLALLTVDDKGRAANGRATTIQLRLEPEQLARVKHSGVRWISGLDLSPGHYQLRVAGRAATTETTGLVTYDLDVPAFDGRTWSMSGLLVTSLPSILMVTQGHTKLAAALKTPPSVSRTFVAGDQLTVAFEVYTSRAAGSVDVAAQVDSLTSVRTVPLMRRTLSPSAEPNGQQVAFVIDTSTLPSDRYVMRVFVQPSGVTARLVERDIPFGIVKPR